MAKDLNKSRMRDTRILMVLVILSAFFTKGLFTPGSIPHEILRWSGFILITACALGRIYASTFIGGLKNEKLVTIGPYSMCRNPLYFYSLLGAAGIGLMSARLLPFIIITAGFYLIYQQLIAREEGFLREKFGAEFDAFKAKVPALIPNPKLYTCPDELLFQPRYLNNAVWDAVWWFAALPLFELADWLHAQGLLPALITLP